MSFLENKKIKFYIILLVVFVGAMYLLFNSYGLVKYIKLENQLEELNTRITELELENRKLVAEIDSLKRSVPSKIEKLAREKYGMMKPNEIKVEFEEKE